MHTIGFHVSRPTTVAFSKSLYNNMEESGTLRCILKSIFTCLRLTLLDFIIITCKLGKESHVLFAEDRERVSHATWI